MTNAPTGAIAIWSGTIASIPTGWNLCDGSGSTPDLRAKFLRGAPADTEAGGTGGSDTHAHTIDAQTLTHGHSLQSTGGHTHVTTSAGAHDHGLITMEHIFPDKTFGGVTVSGAHTHTSDTGGAHTHTSANSTSLSHTHTQDTADSRPPYYEILFIQASSSAAVVAGIIIIWTGLIANIPTGFSLCDGGSGRPDLRSKFTRGAPNGINPGTTGGATTHTHTQQNTDITHSHNASDSQGTHSHTFSAFTGTHTHGTITGTKDNNDRNSNSPLSYTWTHTHAATDSIGAHTHTLDSTSLTTHNHGVSQAGSSLPVYYDVLYIYNTSASDIPQGGILVWIGLIANIPSQYNLCDGTSPRPDLRARFIRGADAGVQPGGTGGSDTHTHTDNSVGDHNHTHPAFSTAHQHATMTDGAGAHTHVLSTGDAYDSEPGDMGKNVSSGVHNHAFTSDAWSHTHTITSAGAHVHTIQSADTRPAYYQAQFIYRTDVIVVPTVTTQAASGLDIHQATLNGTITVTGGENSDSRGFDWGSSPGVYDQEWTEPGSFGAVSFDHQVTTFVGGKLYYYRAKAHNSAGWGYGSEASFTTNTPTLPTGKLFVIDKDNYVFRIDPSAMTEEKSLSIT